MKISGFTFVRNAIKLGYPVVESISSILPVVDELVVNVGDSEDDTLELVTSIESSKTKVITSRWDPLMRSGGRVLAVQANLALSHCDGDWAIYVQADEVLHERDYGTISDAMARYLDDTRVEGLLFGFVHFYANYHTCGVGRKWYQREVRVIRNGLGVEAWKDAQGFRRRGKKLHVRPSGASIYHYGWVRDPKLMKAKIVEAAKFWHDDRTVETKYGAGGPDFPYNTGGRLVPFRGTHPAAMAQRVHESQMKDPVEPGPGGPEPWHERILDWLEEHFGWHPGEYRNYELVPELRRPQEDSLQ